MGTVLKRRDNAPLVKKIYNGATNILLNKKNVAEAAEYVRQQCRELVNGETNLGLLTITKSLRDHYDNPDRIAHKVLADRISLRSHVHVSYAELAAKSETITTDSVLETLRRKYDKDQSVWKSMKKKYGEDSNPATLIQETVVAILKLDTYKEKDNTLQKSIATILDVIRKKDGDDSLCENAPAAGDRVPYVYIETAAAVALQGDRIETPAYIRENGLKPDVGFYITNQLENPIAQLFSPRVEDIPGFSADRFHITAEDPEKQIVLREAAAAKLLFGEALAVLEGVARRKGAERLGFTVRPAVRPTARPVAVEGAVRTAPTAPPKQMVLDSWFATKLLVDNLTKKRQQKKDGKSSK